MCPFVNAAGICLYYVARKFAVAQQANTRWRRMKYFLNLFTPETWQAFREHGAAISGFRHRQRKVARERVGPGDVFLCYLVRLSRWCGVLEITSNAFIDDAPIFSDPDPFVVRFKVRSEVMLEPERSIPITENRIWNHLSITKGVGSGERRKRLGRSTFSIFIKGY